MTKDELIAAIAALPESDRNALLGKQEHNTYKMVSVIRLYWGDKPSKEDREAMSKVGYHWNGFEKFWYADATEETIKFAAEHNFEEAK